MQYQVHSFPFDPSAHVGYVEHTRNTHGIITTHGCCTCSYVSIVSSLQHVTLALFLLGRMQYVHERIDA